MTVGIPVETYAGEMRCPIIPSDVKKLTGLGATVWVESGLGKNIFVEDTAYEQAGAIVLHNKAEVLAADMVLRLRKPHTEEVSMLKPGSIHISYLDPFYDKALLQLLASQQVTAISMEMIPRSTRAQKMDSLSSQASLAGYAAVVMAAEKSNKILPMMTTPAGTIQPSRVFIIGAGVAGLQAIATAKRLGARVDAFDTRPVVAEQIKSLGARYVEVDLGETGQTKDGYAKALTEEQLQKQREVMAKQCALSDIVITTAQVFGKKAPTIITKDMIAGMKPGSLIIDLAIETGGNVEGAVLNETTEQHGVSIVGLANLPAKVAVHASQMYSANLFNLVAEYWQKETNAFVLQLEDEILDSCVMTHAGAVRKSL